MTSRRNHARPLALAVALAALGCRSPASIESTLDLATDRGVVRAVSTEEGILALAETVPASGEVSFRLRVGNGFFDDVAQLERRNDVLAVLRPASSRLNLARFGSYPAALDDRLFIEARIDGAADLLPCRLLDDRRGDLLVPESGVLAEIAHLYAGAGIFAWREKTMQLVGILNGVWCDSPQALAFIGLDEIAALLPADASFFTRRAVPRRADFEYGIPRDFEGEKPSVSDPPKPAGG